MKLVKLLLILIIFGFCRINGHDDIKSAYDNSGIQRHIGNNINFQVVSIRRAPKTLTTREPTKLSDGEKNLVFINGKYRSISAD